ncbi:MAG: endonuclease/exonuclease/phosphatase family protein [Acidobacteriota bacterium]|nr:endonuclease/exonuclease/phosphatase family protein [Acidobacteriota bacterium]
MRVVTFNLHAGVDGWGRRTEALEHLIALAPQVAICPELWRGDDGEDMVATLRARLGLEGEFVALARAERITTGVGPRRWQPRLAHLTGERGLFFREHRELTAQQRTHRGRRRAIETGDWGLGLFTTLPIETIETRPLGRLPREKVRRALVIARLDLKGRPIHVVAVHGSHLSHGSPVLYRRVTRIVESLDPTIPIILGGDFNCWRPLLRVLLPGWRTLARARTWPAGRPHSQIDHLLGRGPWRTLGAGASDGGSDHRALYGDLELADEDPPTP